MQYDYVAIPQAEVPCPPDKLVPSVYGPTADQTWGSADPTTSVEAAGRK